MVFMKTNANLDFRKTSKTIQMYKYEFVRIEMKIGWLKIKPKEDYQEIIKSYAQKGWKFKQIFAPSTTGYGSSSYFDLIFEKEA